MPALQVDNLTVHYGKRVAVDGVSLTIERGEVVALLGPNGAGKSTMLSAIAGALPPTGGSISIAGLDLSREPLGARRKTGFCDQPPTLYEFFTVAEHLAFVGETRGDSRPADQRALLGELGLGDIADRLCRELSFGMRQRVGLAASLIGDVEVVLLDETLNGLDPRAAKAAREVVTRVANAGAAVLMSTHLLGVAERLCGRILIMDGGALKADVAGAELERLLERGAGAVEELYLQHVAESPA